MKDNNVILEVKDLHKSFGEQEVLKGISTEIGRASCRERVSTFV